jgi:hypothetical protein
MSRVEPKPQPSRPYAEPSRRQSGERRENKPSQAEGDERTIEQALENQEEQPAR